MTYSTFVHMCLQSSSNIQKTSNVFVIMTYSTFVYMSLQSSSNIEKTSNVFDIMTYSTFVHMCLQSSSNIQKTSNVFVIMTYSTFVYVSAVKQQQQYTKDIQCLLHHDIQHICPYVSLQASSNILKTSDVFVIMTYSTFVHMSKICPYVKNIKFQLGWN